MEAIIPMIIEFMDYIFNTIFNLTEHPVLQEWVNNVITNVADRTEQQTIGELKK